MPRSVGAHPHGEHAAGDLDDLVALIDRWGARDAWGAVVQLRDLCRAALERGKQLWPAAAYAEYRLALDAPASFAVAVIGSPAERYTLGPFAEVVASSHRWSELAPFVPASPSGALLAHECVARGDELAAHSATVAFGDVLGVPLALEPWEPVYPAAEYAPDRATFDAPPLPMQWREVRSTAGEPLHDGDTIASLTALAATWCRESNGRAEAAAIEGDAAAAIASLGCPRARLASITAQEALAWMAWTAGSGGAHGRRPGLAAGRQAAWWALQHLAGLANEDDVRPDELGAAASEMRWYLWDDGSPATGWSLRLAVEDPAENLAWAVHAVDQRLET
jgi:hypothetical protein